jgi:tRNA pseudouridine32 synthase/23S rRNA pseudouridine746 synthase
MTKQSLQPLSAAETVASVVPVVYRHVDFLLVDKPAGLSFHSEQGEGLVARVAREQGEPLYPVHRLDKDTSGLLLLARSSGAAATLAALFATQQIEKFYLALSVGKPAQKQGWVKGDMQPARSGSYKLLKTCHDPAVSYFVSAGLADAALPTGSRLYLVKPWTGRTHQIRVALKSMSAAIAGDQRYGGSPADRMYLHAYALRFCYQQQLFQFVLAPASGEWFVATATADQLASWAEPFALNWPVYKKPDLAAPARQQGRQDME